MNQKLGQILGQKMGQVLAIQNQLELTRIQNLHQKPYKTQKVDRKTAN